MEADTEISSCVHVNKDICAAAFGELLTCAREPDNTVDRYTVAGLREEPYDRICYILYIGVMNVVV